MFHTYHKVSVITGIVLCLFSSVFAYSGGSGEPNDPYRIATKADLLELAAAVADYNECFVLTADVNMEGQVFTTAVIAIDTNDLTAGFQGTPFTGTFDGSGHKITNFTVDGGNNDYLGLFGYVSSGTVKNLGLEDSTVSGSPSSYESYYAGSLVGQNNSGSISNCYSRGAVNGYRYVGGLVGWNESGSISDCYSTGAVNGYRYVGGLVGWNESGSISNCYSTGTAVSDNSSSEAVGGLVGQNNSGSISNCYSTGAVSGSDYVGGLVGWNYDGSISDCYSTSETSGSNDYVGGLVGRNFYGSISNCYSTGTVSGYYMVGGLVGRNGGSLSGCYSTGAVSGPSHVGGLVGYNGGGTVSDSFWDIDTSGQVTSDGGTGKTTAEMQTQSTFTDAGWDFDYTDGDPADWFIQIDEYPILTWQISPADIYTDGRNNMRDFAVFAQYWMREDCTIYNYYCDWADMDFNGSVDIDDLIMLMSYWLEEGIYN